MHNSNFTSKFGREVLSIDKVPASFSGQTALNVVVGPIPGTSAQPEEFTITVDKEVGHVMIQTETGRCSARDFTDLTGLNLDDLMAYADSFVESRPFTQYGKFKESALKEAKGTTIVKVSGTGLDAYTLSVGEVTGWGKKIFRVDVIGEVGTLAMSIKDIFGPNASLTDIADAIKGAKNGLTHSFEVFKDEEVVKNGLMTLGNARYESAPEKKDELKEGAGADYYLSTVKYIQSLINEGKEPRVMGNIMGDAMVGAASVHFNNRNWSKEDAIEFKRAFLERLSEQLNIV